MHKRIGIKSTKMKVNKSYEGERLEVKIQRIMSNKEPIKDGAPMIYTDRSDGVQPDYDIRTDRWDKAIEGMDVVNKTHRAKREERQAAKVIKMKEEADKAAGKEPGGQSTQGTEPVK